MKNWKWIAALLILLALFTGSAYAAQETASGTCGIELTWNLDSEGTLTISGRYEMSSFTSNSNAPWHTYAEQIKKVVIGKDVESIGDNAFRNLNMTEVIFEDPQHSALKTIGHYAFGGCEKLESITLPDGLQSLGRYSFNGCKALKEIVIPSAINKINDYTFSYCSSLTDIAIPVSVVSIGLGAFRNCTYLQRVYYGGSNNDRLQMEIESDNDRLLYASWDYAGGINGTCGIELTWNLDSEGTLTISGTGAMTDFDWYSGHAQTPWYDLAINILHVVVEDGVTSVGTYAFFDNDHLLSVTLGDNVTVIGGNAFFSCDKLQTVTLGCRVASIGECAFQGNSHLTDVYYSGYDMEAIRMDDYNASLRNASWHYLGNSVTLILPDNLRAIESGALANTAAVGIIIPAGCQSIAPDAFAGCTNLRWIINHSNTTITPPAGVVVVGD